MGCFDRQGEVKADDAKYTGSEPTWDDIGPEEASTTADMRAREALRFYGYYCSKSDLMPDLLEWMKISYTKDEIRTMKRHGEKYNIFTACKLARMINRGMPIESTRLSSWKGVYYDYLVDVVDKTLTKAKADELEKSAIQEESDEPKKPVISPTKRLSNKINEKIMLHLEIVIDSMVLDEEFDEVNIQAMLGENSIPEKGCVMIQEALSKELQDYISVVDETNAELVEAYSFTPKSKMKKVVRTIRDWIVDVEKYRQSVKKTPTVRKKRVKPAGVQVRDLKYKREKFEGDGWEVMSVSPVKVPGANTVYIFNTKTNKLQKYVAINRTGLSVKGTSIKDFDDTKSFQFTIRKGKHQEVLNSADFDKYATRKTAVNGRVNEHCVILSVK